MGVAHRYSVFAFQANDAPLNPKNLPGLPLSAVGNRRSLAFGESTFF